MSLRRIAPLLSRCAVGVGGRGASAGRSALLPQNRLNAASPAVVRRGLSSPPKAAEKKMTAEEVEAALEKANETMKEYYSFPPEKVIAAKKARFEDRHRDKGFYLQLGLAMTMLCSFLVTPFLGRKIAYDDDFRKKYIPEWYDYTIEKPKSAWTKEELHQQVMLLRRQLHERAIAGEFTPEKLEEMRRNLQRKPENPKYAHFAQIHPGVDDDEDIEDE